ncbi:MAG: hypothetical protein ABUS79_07765 [Pseudomonadota bacterium]
MATAPRKAPELSHSPQANMAKTAFREILLAGDYGALDGVTDALTTAYLAAPGDPDLALYLAHAHFWRLAERAREPKLRPTITDHLATADMYFKQAALLSPNDHRIPGWLGGVELALGKLHADEREMREGYFLLEDGISAYPEFNHFSKSYVLSSLPPAHPRFAESIASMWRSVEICGAKGLDHENPDFRAFFRPSAAISLEGADRVCHNVPVAPHNFEGFFLHNGDVLVKAGHPRAARIMYANARLEPSFATWPYRDVLEQRIRTADARADAFRTLSADRWPEMMVSSRMACSGCHQR